MKVILHSVVYWMIYAWLAIPPVNAQKVRGTYEQEEMNNINLHFSEDLFFFQDNFEYTHLPAYNCSDTLAFGYWEKEEKAPFIKLFTNPMQYASLINMSVDESVKEGVDSVYFIINNPIEDQYAKYNDGNENARQVFYTVIIESGDSRYDTEINFKNYYTNAISFGLPKTKKIKSFEITINPSKCVLGWRDNMPPHHVTTLQYEVKNANSNVFRVDIPELTFCYLSTLRLNGDFVKVLSNTQLEWDGHIYTKKK